MDANTPLWKAHDLSQQLQDKIEVLPNVERAFVHVDHESTHIPVRSSAAPLVLTKNNSHTYLVGTSENSKAMNYSDSGSFIITVQSLVCPPCYLLACFAEPVMIPHLY